MPHISLDILLVFASLLLVGSPGCRQSESDRESEPNPQARVKAVLRLTQEAKSSIGIATAAVQSKIVPSTISTTGWLAAKPGHEVTVKAAATGFVVPEEGGNLPCLGDAVSLGQSLGALRLFVSPQDEAQLVALKEEADILVRQSAATLETAQARLERVEQLTESGTVPGKEKQLAKEALEQARAAYEEAQQQLPFLPSEPYERPLQLGVSVIKSPSAGRLTKLYVQPRQLVIEGDPLWTISEWSLLWLRVPIFEGDLPRIDETQAAEVKTPSEESTISATPTGIPQPTEAGRRTVDLFYEVANANGKLRPGEAVSVELPTGKTTKRIVVPKSAVIWDGMANAWVYLEEEHNLFRRQRIQVGPATGESVVVEHGLSEGESIVTVGAEALYGEEFKGQIQVLEDDD